MSGTGRRTGVRGGAAWFAAVWLAAPAIACSRGGPERPHASGSGYGVGRPSPAWMLGVPDAPSRTGPSLPETRNLGGSPELRMIAVERVRQGGVVPGPEYAKPSPEAMAAGLTPAGAAVTSGPMIIEPAPREPASADAKAPRQAQRGQRASRQTRPARAR